MADVCDVASEYEEREREAARERVRAAAAADQAEGDNWHCRDCDGLVLPHERRWAGFATCIDCARENEKRDALRRPR